MASLLSVTKVLLTNVVLVVSQVHSLEDEFGSQWSLASNESIMKEQIEQLEYDKDEITIKYDEMKVNNERY